MSMNFKGRCKDCGSNLIEDRQNLKYFCPYHCEDVKKKQTVDEQTMAYGIANDIINELTTIFTDRNQTSTIVDMIAMLIDARIELHAAVMKPLADLEERTKNKE